MLIVDATNYKYQARKVGLAKLLSDKKINVKFSPEANTGSYDLINNSITLPIFDDYGISEELMDLLVVHEIAHGLFTPGDEYIAAIKLTSKKLNLPETLVSDYYNVIEDLRINGRVQTKFPGSRYDFLVGYRHRFERNDYGTKDINVINSYPFIDRLNIHGKIGTMLNVKFNEMEQELVTQSLNTFNFDEVPPVVEKALKLATAQESRLDYSDNFDIENISIEKNEDENGESTSIKISLNGMEFPLFMPDLEKLKSITQQSENKNTESQKSYIKDFNSHEVPISQTDTITYKEILQYENFNYHSAKNNVVKFLNENRRYINKMISIFEMKKSASTYQRTMTNKTGILNMSKIHHYRYNEDIFKRNQIKPKGKNHGFIFLLDTSASMENHFHDTIKQLLMMVYFARRIQVPFEIYSFSSAGNNKLGLLFDHKMTNKELHNMATRLLSNNKNALSDLEKSGGSTPLISSLLRISQISIDFVKKNKIDILNVIAITDGIASDIPVQGEFLSDPLTGNVFKTEVSGNKYKNAVKTYMNIFRNRLHVFGIHNANFINFYLETGINFYLETGKANNDKLKTNDTEGYDEKYIIPISILKNVNDKNYLFFLKNFTERIS